MKFKSKNLLAAILLAGLFASSLHANITNVETETTNTAENAAAKPETRHPQVHPGKTRPSNETGPENVYLPPEKVRPPDISHWVPIIAIVMTFGMPVAIVGTILYFRHRKTKMLHDTLRAMIEKGVPIPPELLAAPERSYGSSTQPPILAPTQRHQRDDLRHGLILLGIGAGVTALAGKVGLIILFIGLAMITASLIDRRDKTNQLPPK